MSNERWVSQEEIDEMKKARPTCGNEALDFYWLGYEAGKEAGVRETEPQVEQYRNWWRESNDTIKAIEAERDELAAKVEKLRRKIKKLKGRAE